jgi:hypothetical protein
MFFENVMETHLTCISYSAHGHLTEKCIFYVHYVITHRLLAATRQLMETGGTMCILFFMQIVEYLHENLWPTVWKPSLQQIDEVTSGRFLHGCSLVLSSGWGLVPVSHLSIPGDAAKTKNWYPGKDREQMNAM